MSPMEATPFSHILAMNTNIDLICVPHRCACERHGGGSLPEGQTHATEEKCPYELAVPLRVEKGAVASCCAMRGTLLAIVLAQVEADHTLGRLSHSLSPKEADDVAGELWNLEERIHEEILTYLDEEEGAKPSVEIRIPTTPDGHWKHSWHLPRVPVRKAIDILNESARWYSMVAERGFGVLHEWHEASSRGTPRR